jgi:hypothetical protein
MGSASKTEPTPPGTRVNARLRLVGVNFDGFFFRDGNVYKNLPVEIFRMMQSEGTKTLERIYAAVNAQVPTITPTGSRVFALFQLTGENEEGFSAVHEAEYHSLPVEVFNIIQGEGIALLKALDALAPK